MATEDAVHAPEVPDTPAPAPAAAPAAAPPAAHYQQGGEQQHASHSQDRYQQPSGGHDAGDDKLPMFVGGLNNPCDEAAFEALVNEFGPTTSVAVRTPVGRPGMAFVKFANAADRDRAVASLNGRDFEGRPLRAEVSHGKKRRDEPRGDRGDRRSRGPGGNFVRISGVTEFKDWRELKDTLRVYGEVRYADYKDMDQVIIAEFDEADGMDSCLRALNGGEQLFGFSVTAQQDEERRSRGGGGGGRGGGRGGFGGDRGGGRGGYGGDRGGGYGGDRGGGRGGYGGDRGGGYGGDRSGGRGGYGGDRGGGYGGGDRGGYGGGDRGGYGGGGDRYGAPPAAGGYGGGGDRYGAPPAAGGYGGGGDRYGAPPAAGGYGGGGDRYGAPPAAGGYGGDRGAPPAGGGYGAPARGAPPAAGGYGGYGGGAPPAGGGYGGYQ